MYVANVLRRMNNLLHHILINYLEIGFTEEAYDTFV